MHTDTEQTNAGHELLPLVTRREAADFLRCSVRHVINLGIPFHRLGHSVVYRREHVMAALGSPTSATGASR
jgi:hypothetical protein